MLIHLSIHNYALIKELEADFGNGLHIITGETGAGKSVLLGALSLILGERADSRAVFESGEKCIIEAGFDIRHYHLEDYFSVNDLDYAQVTLLRREITSQGKSRAFVNDTPVSLTVLRDLGERLVDIHSQHETISLKEKKYQLEVVDTFAGSLPLLDQYRLYYRQHRELRKKWTELGEKENQIRSEYEYHAFLLQELEDAGLSEQEQEEHEREQKMLENAGDIARTAYNGALALKNGENPVLDMLREIQSSIKALAKADVRFATLGERLGPLLAELDDIAAELGNIAENTLADDVRKEWLNERLSLIYQLQRKHRVETAGELLAVQQGLAEKVRKGETLDEELAAIKEEMEKAAGSLKETALKLSEKRLAAIPVIERSFGELLGRVGMPDAKVVVAIQSGDEFLEQGADKVELLFSSNVGSLPQPLHKIASGGELSRLMLCLKSLLARHMALPTLIFDEIDTGISGELAAKVGKLMRELAQGHQVISVTHLPQIAAAGKAHFYVYKETRGGKTYTRLKKLTEQERLDEIARMLSGENPGASALANARELLSH